MENNVIQSFNNFAPTIHPNAFVHPNAVIIGDVTIHEGASIWPGAVLRGDMGPIEIGQNSSVQDGTICHMTENYSKTIVGNNVTIGHGVILHGCVIDDWCLIGMGSILLDNAMIGRGSFVAAGSLVTGNKSYSPNSFICGSPAKFIRQVGEKEINMTKMSIKHYQSVVKKYQKGS